MSFHIDQICKNIHIALFNAVTVHSDHVCQAQKGYYMQKNHHKSSQHDFYATFQVSWSHMTDNLLFTDKLFTDNLNLRCSALPQISSTLLFWFKMRHWYATQFLMSLKSNNITCILCCIIMLYANSMLGKSRQPSRASRSQGTHINTNEKFVYCHMDDK